MAVYFEPRKAFSTLRQYPMWITMMIVLVLLSTVVAVALTARVDRTAYLRKMFDQSRMTREMPEEQKRTAIEQAAQSPMRWYLGVAFTPFITTLIYVILAAIFLGYFLLMGASLSFKQAFVATVWAMGAPSILFLLLSILFAFLKDPTELDMIPANNAVTNLGVLVSQREHPLLYALLGSLDIFSFWTIFLLAVGFSEMTNHYMSPSKTAIGILVLWFIYVAGKVGLAALFS